MRVAPAGNMQIEELEQSFAIEREALIELAILEPLACPGAQWAAQPAIDRHAESLLRALDDLARQVPCGEAPQEILALRAAQLPLERQFQAPFDQLMIEQRLARF